MGTMGTMGDGMGRAGDGYRELYIFVRETKELIYINEGTGENLHPEDEELGYVDYIYYEQYGLGNGLPEVGGGQVMLRGMFRDVYRCTADCIPDVLDLAYGCSEVEYVLLE